MAMRVYLALVGTVVVDVIRVIKSVGNDCHAYIYIINLTNTAVDKDNSLVFGVLGGDRICDWLLMRSRSASQKCGSRVRGLQLKNSFSYIAFDKQLLTNSF
jgi:hypothetical protein